jgi:hypothetical protein
MRRNFCQACSFEKFGVKTRLSIPHTCGEKQTTMSIKSAEPLRRIRLDLMEPAEKAIYNAMQEVEKIGADVLLTEAVILLGKAKDLVSDFIDKKE